MYVLEVEVDVDVVEDWWMRGCYGGGVGFGGRCIPGHRSPFLPLDLISSRTNMLAPPPALGRVASVHIWGVGWGGVEGG